MRRVTSKAGFSTLEMIFTTLILALSMTILTSGASAVSAIYRRTLAKADAQMIYSQIETNLRADLTFADAVDNYENVTKYVIQDVTYTLSVGADGALYAGFTYKEKPYDNPLSPTQQKRLEDLKVKDLPKITYDKDNGYFTVSGLQVEYDGQNMIANTDEPQFVIRAANDVTTIS